MRSAVMIVMMCVVMLMAAAADAQTAHFNYTQSVVVSGLDSPYAVARDAQGALYVGGGLNSVSVQKYVLNGSGGYTLSGTVGSGFDGVTGVAVASTGDVFVREYRSGVVHRYSTDGSGGYIQRADIPTGVATVDGAVNVDRNDNLFIVDGYSSILRSLADGSGGYAAAVEVATSDKPSGIAIDSSGNLYVASYGGSAVQKFAPNGAVYTQQADVASGYQAYGVSVDGAGVVYASYGNANLVFKYVPNGSGGYIQSPNLGSGLNFPYGNVLDADGNLFLVDSGNNRLFKLSNSLRNFSKVNIGSATTQTLTVLFDTAATIAAPVVLTAGVAGLDFTDAGTGTCTTNGTSHSYAAGDSCTVDVTFTPAYPGKRSGSVLLKTAGGATIATTNVYGTGVGPLAVFIPGTTNNLNSGSTHLSYPYQVALNGAGDAYVSNPGIGKVIMVPAAGGSGVVISPPAAIDVMRGVALDGAGDLFIADNTNNLIYVMPASGTAGVLNITGLPSHITGPTALVIDNNGDLYIADSGNSRVVKVSLNLASLGTGSPTGVGSVLATPGYNLAGSVIPAITLDLTGAIYISDIFNNRVLKVAADGSVSTVNTGAYTLNHPQGLAVDAAGNLYIADSGKRLLEVTAAGAVLPLGLPQLGDNPYTMTLDPRGYLLISDFTNNRVLTIDVSAAANALSFGNIVVGSTSASQTLAVQNSGNADLTISIPSSGNNPSISTGFVLSSSGASACPLVGSAASTPGTLAAGAACLLPISFAPATAGSFAGSLVLTDNNLNASPSTMQSIPLSGTGIDPLVATTAVSSVNLTVGNAITTFTPVTASGGTTPYSFSISPSLPAGISFNAATGAVSGTPTASSPATTYTVTVTDATSATASSTFSLTVNANTPTLTFVAIGSKTYGDAPFTVSATSASSGAVTYSVVSGPATVSGNTVTITGAGTVQLQASQAANGGYTSATATTSFNVTAATPTLTFAAIQSKTYGDSPFAVSATSASNGAVTYMVASGPATVSGSTVTITGAGSVQLLASQAADGGYGATTATTSFNVAMANVTLTFAAIPQKTYGDAPFTVSATSASNGAVTYSVASGPATVSGSTVTITGIGNVTLNASQAATSNYNAATATTSFNVQAANPTLTFAAIPSKIYGDAPFLVGATSNSNGAISYSVISGPATISGSAVTITGAGTITLGASQVASGNYAAATATATVVVAKATPSITFSSLGSGVYSGSPVTVTATSTSTGALTLAVTSGPATASGSSVTITSAGTVIVSVNQASDANYNSYSGSATFVLNPANPTLTFAPIGAKTYGDAPFVVSASSASSGAVTYSVVSGPATVSGSTVSITGAGAVTLLASQAATTNYAAANATTSFVVSPAPLTVTANSATRYYGANNPALTGSVSGAKYSDSFTASYTTAAVSSSPVGSYSILPTIASSSASGNYAITYVNGTLTVTQAPTATTVALSSSAVNPNQTVTLTAAVVPVTSGSPTGTVTFFDNGVALRSATVAAGTATATTIFASGSHSVTASYSGDTNFLPSASTGSGAGITVPQLDFTITGPATATMVSGGVLTLSYTLTPTFGAYPGPVSIDVQGAPTDSAVDLSRTAVAASAGPQSFTMTVRTSAIIAAARPESHAPWALAFFLVPLFGVRRMRRAGKGVGRALLMLAIMLATAAGFSGLTGCGYGYLGLNTKNYSVTVRATSGGVQRTTTTTLTVNRPIG